MIDDEVLEELLREAAETVAVPVDGPGRVLAARGPVDSERPGLGRLDPRRPSGRRHKTPRRRVALAGLAAVTAVGLLAAVVSELGASSGPASVAKHAAVPLTTAGKATIAGRPIPGAAPLPAGSAQQEAPAAGSGSTFSGNAAAGLPAQPPTTAVAGQTPGAPTKVIKTGAITLQVGHGQLNPTIDQLTSDATALGGYVASTNTQAASGATASGDIALRVPAAYFERLLNLVRQLGTATTVTTAGQDVTSQYVDLNARLQSLQDARTQFQQILARAQTIGDILAVEQQISDLQTQIEQLQGQLRIMDDHTTYGTLAVTVNERTTTHAAVRPTSSPSGVSKAWAHARHTFARGLEAVIGSLGGIAVFLTCVLALATLGRLGWGVVRRRLV
jgi:hypothetical protein